MIKTRVDVDQHGVAKGDNTVLITIYSGAGYPMHQGWCTPDEALLLARQIHDALEGQEV